MIDKNSIAKLINDAELSLNFDIQRKSIPGQIFRGMTSLKWKQDPVAGIPNCDKYLKLFDERKIIPAYCFTCYKIQIEPANVIDLIKLMLLFNTKLVPGDNTRKCFVELRPSVGGTYKGLIYYQDLEQAKKDLPVVTGVVKEKISEQIPVALKRGCSEYANEYPQYAAYDDVASDAMRSSDWDERESRYYQENGSAFTNANQESHNRAGFSMVELRIIVVWLRYAATIGDTSYKTFTKYKFQIIPGISRS